ncbi:MAG TPA: hypothetical protein VHF22_11045 [Planctomycetota bacterium]|nr:hypothetical protein [Planctomycetota bacterium]
MRGWRAGGRTGSALVLLVLASGAAARAEEGIGLPMDAIPGKPNLRGSFRTIGQLDFLEYNDKPDYSTQHGTDHAVNLIEYASLQATGLGDPRISAVASARWQLDAVKPGSDSELRDLSDAEPARRHLKLFEAYGEARDLGDVLTVRAGRQSVDTIFPVFLDGGRVDVHTPSGALRATGYGGLRASMWSGTDDHAVVGGEVGARPVAGLDVVAGYFHYVVDSYGLEVREAPIEGLDFVARANGIGGGISEVTGEVRDRIAPAGLELRLGYTRWFENVRFPYDYTFERAPATGVTRLLVGSRTDGNEGRIELLFDLIPHVVASARYRLFRPVQDDRDPYNLAYDEVSPALEVYDLPWRGLELDVRYTAYRADTGPPANIDDTTVEGFTDLRGEGVESYDEVSADLAQRFGTAVRASIGGIVRRETYEDRFGKLTNARAYDARAEMRWLATSSWTFIVRYDYAQGWDLIEPVVDWQQRVTLEVRYAF